MSLARVVAVAAFVVTSLTGCGTAIEPAEPVTPEQTGTVSQGLCVGQCDQERPVCEQYCIDNFHPYWDEQRYFACMDNCNWEYERCLDYTYVYEGPSNTICHIDPDTHTNGVDVELHTVDVYKDSTCADSPRYYRKRVLDSVHCGWISPGQCENRVEYRITTTWIPQQVYPTMTPEEGDVDKCPGPRL